MREELIFRAVELAQIREKAVKIYKKAQHDNKQAGGISVTPARTPRPAPFPVSNRIRAKNKRPIADKNRSNQAKHDNLRDKKPPRTKI